MDINKKESLITNFSLAELLAMSGENIVREGIMRECIIVNSSSHMSAFRFPYRIDAYIIGIGTAGETSISCNLKEYRLKKNTLFIFEPSNILQTHDGAAFDCNVMIISPDLMRSINLDTKYMMPLLLQFAANPCMEISDEECEELRQFLMMVEKTVIRSKGFFAKDIISSQIGATLYKIGDLLHNYYEAHPHGEESVQNRAEEYFRQFMKLLSIHYKSNRNVGFYAKELCITPKYLTTLIKRISGKSVSEWIDNYVILEAKTLLKFSNKSIQEIAYDLNFPNQSFFGSYFKRNTGMSPSQYKAAE